MAGPLASLLQTADPAQLGKGKDVALALGAYDELRLASAWRIEHPDNRKKYGQQKPGCAPPCHPRFRFAPFPRSCTLDARRTRLAHGECSDERGKRA